MITLKTWETLRKKQAELDQLIFQASQVNFPWVSLFNAKRLKLGLSVEVGEFANEIRTFKIWRKKPEVDWDKAKEELIDCLGYFLGLVNIYQIEFPHYEFSFSNEKEFNELLLEFFSKTSDLYLVENESFYTQETKLTDQTSYYDWLKTFQKLCVKLLINEQELLDIYCRKNEINQQRVKN